MFSKLRNRMESEEGFTLIELLVVILIIGILAAIAIPSFLSQRTRGQDACAKSMAKQMQTAMKTAQIDNGSYTGTTLATLTNIENSIQAGQCGTGSAVTVGNAIATNACDGATSPGTNTFCVSAASASGNVFSIGEAAGGTITRSCTVPAGNTLPYGGCQAGNTW